ncbi:MAG: CopG family antitoxin [Syntrophaceticus sp.]|jgi:predicted DNA binding CopG/RHH family protein
MRQMRVRRLKRENKKRVNLRLEPSLIELLREIAEEEGVGYQTMIRSWLWEKVNKAS